MKKPLTITVRGKHHEWNFDVQADPRYLQEWRDDGLEIYVVENSIPEWVVGLGLTRAWCFLQDCFYFKNPLAR